MDDIEIIKINARESFVEIAIKYKGVSYQGLLLKGEYEKREKNDN